MKIMSIGVEKETYLKLQRGELLLDVRLDSPVHEKGDILIYSMVDDRGQPVDGANIAFLISTKVALGEFATRIGEQLARKSATDPDDLVIVTLTPIPGQEDITT